MRTLLFLPVAYVAGEHGFVFFAPYLVFVLLTVAVVRRMSDSRTRPTPRPVEARP
jgi:hypothetical protein